MGHRKKKISSWLVLSAEPRVQSHDLEMTTQAEIKSHMPHWVNLPRTLLTFLRDYASNYSPDFSNILFLTVLMLEKKGSSWDSVVAWAWSLDTFIIFRLINGPSWVANENKCLLIFFSHCHLLFIYKSSFLSRLLTMARNTTFNYFALFPVMPYLSA